MRAPTTVKLVRGRHDHTPIPKVVKKEGWGYRAAVVIDSYVPGEPEMWFDSALFVRFLRSIDDAMKATSRQISMVDPRHGKTVELTSVDALDRFYQEIGEEDRDLPEEVIWLEYDVKIGGGFAEKWYAVGGPEIYHDSFTFSVFTKKDIFPILAAAAENICKAANARLLGMHEGGRV